VSAANDLSGLLCSGNNRFLGAGGELNRYEEIFGIKIVLPGLVLDSQLPQNLGIGVRNHLIKLPALKGSGVVVIIYANYKVLIHFILPGSA
jgi:hypothetical protein